MFIRKSKINTHINNVRQAEKERQERITKKRIAEIEKKHKKEILQLKAAHYKNMNEKNQELKKAREGWAVYKQKAIELGENIQKVSNLLCLYTRNTADMYKTSQQITESMERAERFILNNEARINKLLGVE